MAKGYSILVIMKGGNHKIIKLEVEREETALGLFKIIIDDLITNIPGALSVLKVAYLKFDTQTIQELRWPAA